MRRLPTLPAFPALLAVFLVSIGTTGCEAIATIFEAGVWVGVILVALVIAVIFGLVRMLGGGRGP
jgi:hypothetical protein